MIGAWGFRQQARMHRNAIYLICCAVLLVSKPSFSVSPDFEREARLAEEVEAVLFDGEIVYLDDGERDFLSILTEPVDSDSRGAVIVLHGRGFHPDWPQVAGPIRSGLSELGWTTLSLQMPVLEKDAKYYDYVPVLPESFPRIESGLDFLISNGYDWIAVVAHSCSVHMSMEWIRTVSDEFIDAYVGIGMGATDYQQYMANPFPLEEMSVPVLDIFGSNDYDAVVNGAPDRNTAILKAGNASSSQVEIPGPDHFFEGFEDELVEAVHNWLVQLRP